MEGAGNMENAPTPLYVTIPWIIIIITCLTFYLYLRFKPGHTTMYGPTYLENKIKQN